MRLGRALHPLVRLPRWSAGESGPYRPSGGCTVRPGRVRATCCTVPAIPQHRVRHAQSLTVSLPPSPGVQPCATEWQKVIDALNQAIDRWRAQHKKETDKHEQAVRHKVLASIKDSFGLSRAFDPCEYAWVDLASARAFQCEDCLKYWHDINVQPQFPTGNLKGRCDIVIEPVTKWNPVHGRCRREEGGETPPQSQRP
eukprot:1344719-Rhodomonas_salina.4